MSSEKVHSGLPELTTLEEFTSVGGRLVRYEYCVSLIALTLRGSSRIHRVPGRGSRRVLGMAYALFSLLFGWWGVPWGLIYTPQVILIDLQGGRDVTEETMGRLGRAPIQENR